MDDGYYCKLFNHDFITVSKQELLVLMVSSIFVICVHLPIFMFGMYVLLRYIVYYRQLTWYLISIYLSAFGVMAGQTSSILISNIINNPIIGHADQDEGKVEYCPDIVFPTQYALLSSGVTTVSLLYLFVFQIILMIIATEKINILTQNKNLS